MHRSFLEFLADPASGQPLRLEGGGDGDLIAAGSLVSSHGRYPIVGGIPRFAGYSGENYADSFSYEWNRWARVQFDSGNVGGLMEGYSRRMWESITGLDASDLRGAMIGDFGCGSGRFIETAMAAGARVIGLDLSYAVEAARANFPDQERVLICQADLQHPPLRAGLLDGAFSIGVLHHTPAPAAGFQAMAASVKPGGWVAVSVYPRRGFYDFPTVTLYRRLFKRLWPLFGHRLPLAYSHVAVRVVKPMSTIPLLGQMLRVAFPFARLADDRWSLLDTFDAVTPSYQSTHEPYEVFRWLKDFGLEDIEPSPWGGTSWHGRRPLAA